MSQAIQLEYMSCRNCGRDMEKWNLKAEVVEGVLCVRCPHCREHLRLIMKGGDDYKDGASTGEAETQHPQDLTTKEGD